MARGRSPTRPMACCMKKRFTGGSRSTSGEPGLARQPHRKQVVGEQAVDAVGDRDQRHAVEAPPGRVALQRHAVARIEAQPQPVDDDLGQRCNVT